MVIPKEILTDYKEVYEKAQKLINDESKNDPMFDPFRSHYAARDVLLEMYTNLKNSICSVKAEMGNDSGIDEQELQEDLFIYQVIMAFVCQDLGRIYVFTEEISTGEIKLQECIDSMENHKLKPEAIIPYIGSINELAVVYSDRGEHSQAHEKLQEAENTYLEFKKSGKEALSLTDIFGTREEIEKGKGLTELEKLYTVCIFCMAQIFTHLGDLAKSAKYCHKSLYHQLLNKSYEPIDFALNAATLSQYFIKMYHFKQARQHLAAATLIITEYEAVMVTPDMTEQQINEVQEEFKHRYADVARCWVKYGLSLLSASKERLMSEDAKLAIATSQLSLTEDFSFPTLDLKDLESQVKTSFCLIFSDAKAVYHFVVKWLEKALSYYKLETEASEHAKIIKDYFDLFELIEFFEEDPVNKMKMHKRRAKLYEELQEKLNPVFYMDICRECWNDSALAYCDMLNIKWDMMKAIRTPDSADIIKFNQICNQAIKNFLRFIDSFRENNALKKNIDTDQQRAILYAYFHLGRLHYKKISPDSKVEVEKLTKSLEYYKTFLKECEERPEVAATLQTEISYCKEMIGLLRLNIAKYNRQNE